MLQRLSMSVLLALCLLGVSLPAFAQTGSATATLTGTVVDPDGGFVPGASVVAKNQGTGQTYPATTNAKGVFSLPALPPGNYTVTISMTSFKTIEMPDVRVTTEGPRDIQATLQLGRMSDTVKVAATSELRRSQSTAVSSTLSVEQIANVPLVTRNALHFVTFLPGVDTGGTHSQRASTVMGLPQSALGISLDGVNIQDNLLKSTDGFLALIRPQIDQIEELTLVGAVPGADSSGQGAVQIKFVTRSGTNTFTGSAYHYLRHPSLNSNAYFNEHPITGGASLPKNRVVLNQIGVRVGGPLMVPGLFDGRNRAFFFFNYEEFRQPTNITRQRTVLSPAAQAGVFSYLAGGQLQTVNLYALAASLNQTATPDPAIGALLSSIRAAASTTGNLSAIPGGNPNVLDYVFQSPSEQIEHLPTAKLDFSPTSRIRASFSYNFQTVNADPDLLNGRDPSFPGFPNSGLQNSHRHSGAATVRSTIKSSIVNEARVGFLLSPQYFAENVTAAQFANQGGFSIVFPGDATGVPMISGATSARNANNRDAWNWNIDVTTNWLKGRHSFQFGESFTQVNAWLRDRNVVPEIALGVDSNNDPAAAMFTAQRFPGASAGDLVNARALYAMLTGRVIGVNGDARLAETTNAYGYLGTGTQRGRLNDFGLFAQDTWRARANLTITAGLRWELQLPFYPQNDLYSTATIADACGRSGTGSGPGGRPCTMFAPGTLPESAVIPTYQPYSFGNPGYKTDKNNFAPNIGVAFRPNVEGGLFRKIFGDPQQATFRAGWAVAYNRNGMNDYISVYGANPGGTITANRNAALGNLVNAAAGEKWPVLFRETNRLGPPEIQNFPVYPMPVSFADGIHIFAPDWQVPLVRSFTLGFTRSLGDNMSAEIRYVGTRLSNGNVTENWNGDNVDIVANQFFREFKLAQANLYANIAAGRGQTFAYFGPGTNTSPLPIYLANFNGLPEGSAGVAASYTGPNWTNPTRTAELQLLNPSPLDAANNLFDDASFRANMLAAGYPANFFVMNPDVRGVFVNVSKGKTHYDSIVLEVRRRLSQGLLLSANYTYSRRYIGVLDDLRQDYLLVRSPDSVPNAFKIVASYELPFGAGRRFGANMKPGLDRVFGNWTVNVAGRVQSGSLLNFGNVRVVGMSLEELQKSLDIRFGTTTDPVTGQSVPSVFYLPQDIIDNTIKAFSVNVNGYTQGAPAGRYLAPANSETCIQTYRGDAGCHVARDVFVTGPLFTRFDFSLKKRLQLSKTFNLDLELDLLNVFNAINFNPGTTLGTNLGSYRVTSAYSDINNTYDPGGRLGQFVWRLNW